MKKTSWSARQDHVALELFVDKWNINTVAAGFIRDTLLLELGVNLTTTCNALDLVLNEARPTNASAAVITLLSPVDIGITEPERAGALHRILTEIRPKNANPIVMALFPEPGEPAYPLELIRRATWNLGSMEDR